MGQPSAALVAESDAKSAPNDPFLGLGAVALLVGVMGVLAGSVAIPLGRQ